MCNRSAMILLGALALFCPAFSLAAEAAPGDASQFLKQSGLETIHATYAKSFALLSEYKTETASQLLIDTLPAGVNEATREQVCQFTAQLSAVFARGVEDVELVGALKISSKCAALYYVLNGQRGPVLVIVMPFHVAGSWRTHSWFIRTDATEIMELTRGITRFSENVVVPTKRRDKTA